MERARKLLELVYRKVQRRETICILEDTGGMKGKDNEDKNFRNCSKGDWKEETVRTVNIPEDCNIIYVMMVY